MRLVWLFLLLLVPIALAQSVTLGYSGTSSISGVSPSFGADWVSAPVKYSWDYVYEGFCDSNSQCLVNPGFSSVFDNNVDAYFLSTSSAARPRCIDSSQYLLDHLCVNGEWSSRTRLVAEQLLALADSSAGSFSLYCDSYENVLNKYDYLTSYGFVRTLVGTWCDVGSQRVPCVNDFCVLEYDGEVAFGTALNVPIDDGDKSFLFALNLSEDYCNAVSGSGFSRCGGKVWFDPLLDLVVYSDDSLPPTASVAGVLDSLHDNVVLYANDVVDPVPSFVNLSPDFSRFYLAKEGDKILFSEKSVGITDLDVDYAAWHFYKFSLPNNLCDFFLLGDSRTYCASQPYADSFFVYAYKLPAPLGFTAPASVVDEWSRFVGGVRV